MPKNGEGPMCNKANIALIKKFNCAIFVSLLSMEGPLYKRENIVLFKLSEVATVLKRQVTTWSKMALPNQSSVTVKRQISM